MKKYLIALIACFVPLAAMAGSGELMGSLATTFVSQNIINDVFTAARTGKIDILYSIHQDSPKSLSYAVNAKDKNGQTPLMIACQKGHVLVAMYLVDQGADVDTPDEKGRPALYYAFTTPQQKARKELVVWLVSTKHAKPVTIDKDKAWFVDEAIKNGLSGVATTLLPATLKNMNNAEKSNLLFHLIWRAKDKENSKELSSLCSMMTTVMQRGGDINAGSIQEFWGVVENTGNTPLFRYLAARPQVSVKTAAIAFEDMLKADNPTYADIVVEEFLKSHNAQKQWNDCYSLLAKTAALAEDYGYKNLSDKLYEKKKNF